MGAMASQITSITIVYSTVHSDADQRKHKSSVSLAFVRGIHRWPVNSPHKGPVTREMLPFDDVIMHCSWTRMGWPQMLLWILAAAVKSWIYVYIDFVLGDQCDYLSIVTLHGWPLTEVQGQWLLWQDHIALTPGHGVCPYIWRKGPNMKLIDDDSSVETKQLDFTYKQWIACFLQINSVLSRFYCCFNRHNYRSPVRSMYIEHVYYRSPQTECILNK